MIVVGPGGPWNLNPAMQIAGNYFNLSFKAQLKKYLGFIIRAGLTLRPEGPRLRGSWIEQQNVANAKSPKFDFGISFKK